MENSCTASSGILKSFPRPSADEVTEIPSTINKLPFVRCPSTLTGSGDPLSPGAPGFTPALRSMSCCQVRPFNGISATCLLPMTCETSALSDESNCAGAASTRIDSVTLPVLSAKSTRTVWFTSRRTGPNTSLLKPLLVTLTKYEPGLRLGETYNPRPYLLSVTDRKSTRLNSSHLV